MKSDDHEASLLLEGDWACAFGDVDALRSVCRKIARADDALAERAKDVADWAQRDLVVATVWWLELAAMLRGRRGTFAGA